MQKCPNCGQTTARTEDWACQWCGYPLLSESYKKIPKTYKQLKEEKLDKQKPLMREETELSLLPDYGAVPPMHTLESKSEPVLESEPEPIIEPEPVLESEPEPIIEPEPVLEAEPEPLPAAIEVTAEEVLSAYETDGVVADAKFASKILKVTGVVNRIEVSDVRDVYEIRLTSAEKTRLESVRCTFDKRHGAELERLTTGQTVAVQGKYNGSMIDIRIRDCVLVH